MKILIAADLHIGKNGFKTSNEKWAAPLVELVDYAIENSVDAVAFAGDVQHRRNPTTWAAEFVHWQLGRLEEAGIDIFGTDGNHDDAVAADSVSSSWHLPGTWARKTPDVVTTINRLDPDINFVLLPWVTPQAYIDTYPTETQAEDQKETLTALTLNEQLTVTQGIALKAIANLRVPDAINILIGHAMVSYGPGAEDLAPSPGLQWAGKDVVFDYNTLAKGFDYVALGHVHDSRMKGFVGSSQPTDWGDAGQVKSFIELVVAESRLSPELVALGYEYTRAGDHVCATKRIPYKTSLKLLDVQTVAGDWDKLYGDLEDIALAKYDVGRFKHHVPAGYDEPSAEKLATIRSNMEKLCDRVESIEVTKERTVVQRVVTDTPLAVMDPGAAMKAWLRHSNIDAKTSARVRSKFDSLLETHSKK
ncbi:hypothetical protein LCGC14_2608350 [marine sediment metagenome]|uniref:Calcineurin-like phosphoesterase domain-containing protein n=1 Tax=marine sediment metagenome TaxID=412755 RepID=A0A0F9CZG0_9ZZZZ